MSGLSLTRRVGESILIGDHIKVMVTQIKGGEVRIVISAPYDVRVDREEVRERIMKDGQRS